MASATMSIYCFLAFVAVVSATDLTFELPDHEKFCVYEHVGNEQKGVKVIVDYQVIHGGNYDVDVEVKSPSGRTLYREIRRQYDSTTIKADEVGPYEFCFSNEFSTFSNKLVYIDVQVGEEKPIVPHMAEHATAMTQMETSAVTIHGNAKAIQDYQTHHRLREASGRSFAEDVNERVFIWSAAQLVLIVAVSVGQVLTLRSFFNERKGSTKASFTAST